MQMSGLNESMHTLGLKMDHAPFLDHAGECAAKWPLLLNYRLSRARPTSQPTYNTCHLIGPSVAWDYYSRRLCSIISTCSVDTASTPREITL